MKVASLELSEKLYKLSGWGNGFKDLSTLSAYWRAGKLVDEPTIHKYAPDVLLGEFYGRMLFTVPAYDLSYLLDKMGKPFRDLSFHGWGLIEILPSGKMRKCVDSWMIHKKNIDAEHYLLFYYARRAYYAGVHKTVLDYRGFN